MEAAGSGDEGEESDPERRRDDPHDCAGGPLRLLAVVFELVLGGGAGLNEEVAAEVLVAGVGGRVEAGEDAGGRNGAGEGVEADVEILESGAVVEVGRYGSGEGVVGEIDVGDGREGRDFPRDDSGERVSAQIQTNQLLAMTNVPRDATVHGVPLQFNVVNRLAPYEIGNLAGDLRRRGGENLKGARVPYVTG